MGKTGDGGEVAHSPEVWLECLRVAKPGAYLLAFGGTRTFHRLAVAIEDAGWEIRDTVMWVYGSGFPKSHNLDGDWKGWGTALKPAWEPIIVARKLLEGTVAENVQKYGTGAMNIDAARVEVDPEIDDMLRTVERGRRKSETWENGSGFKNETNHLTGVPASGRWPANVIHDGSEEVVALFPQSDHQIAATRGDGAPKNNAVYQAMKHGDQSIAPRGDSGSAARFFYCAKASRSERNAGLEGMEERNASKFSGGANDSATGRDSTKIAMPNHHPTVKPVALMEYLVKLVTPAGAIVLDPFMGSGTTGIACANLGRHFIGVEKEAEYFAIAEKRIADAQRQMVMEL